MESSEGPQPLAKDIVPVRVHCEAADCNALLEVGVAIDIGYMAAAFPFSSARQVRGSNWRLF